MNKSFILIIVIVIFFIGVVIFWGNKRNEAVSPQAQATPTPSPEAERQEPTNTPKTVIINMTDTGLNPSEITINAGDRIEFINQSLRPAWPASAVHPTHQAYPGSDIKKCGTDESNSIFDACRGLQKGESFSFTFKEKGTWFFHDHLNSSLRGSIIVN